MDHPLFPSVDALLAPRTLSTFGAEHVDSVQRLPVYPGEANSGSQFFRIETNQGSGARFVLKCVAPVPERNRTIVAWQHGILDRLPSAIHHALVACAHDGAGYAILMHDVGDVLLPVATPLTIADHEQVLDTMAAMHATLWEDPQLREPMLGLEQPTYFYPTPDAEGWAFTEQYLDADVAKLVRRLLEDPYPLYQALGRYPATLVHNDGGPTLGLYATRMLAL